MKLAFTPENKSNRESEAVLAERAAYRQRSAEKLEKSRRARLKRLTEEEPGIRDAVDAYAMLDQGHRPRIIVRRGFIRLATPRTRPQQPAEPPEEVAGALARRRAAQEVASRPPLTRLVHRDTAALSLYLTGLYVAQITTPSGQLFKNERHNSRTREETLRSWSYLAGFTAPKELRARQARVRRAVDELVTARLATIKPPDQRKRYDRWNLLDDAGTEGRYRIPGERDPGVPMPASFFFHGWHLVLTPA